jgi:hypothetical protein
MRVEPFYRTDPDRSLVDPLPEKNGLVFRLLSGDVCDPWLDPDGWFKPRLPTFTVRFWSYLPLPFLAWRLGKWSGYIGFKVYGVDSEHYLGWLPDEDVYPGSQAMCLSFRPFARIE